MLRKSWVVLVLTPKNIQTRKGKECGERFCSHWAEKSYIQQCLYSLFVPRWERERDCKDMWFRWCPPGGQSGPWSRYWHGMAQQKGLHPCTSPITNGKERKSSHKGAIFCLPQVPALLLYWNQQSAASLSVVPFFGFLISAVLDRNKRGKESRDLALTWLRNWHCHAWTILPQANKDH